MGAVASLKLLRKALSYLKALCGMTRKPPG
jgi:hypothetical protein